MAMCSLIIFLPISVFSTISNSAWSTNHVENVRPQKPVYKTMPKRPFLRYQKIKHYVLCISMHPSIVDALLSYARDESKHRENRRKIAALVLGTSRIGSHQAKILQSIRTNVRRRARRWTNTMWAQLSLIIAYPLHKIDPNSYTKFGILKKIQRAVASGADVNAKVSLRKLNLIIQQYGRHLPVRNIDGWANGVLTDPWGVKDGRLPDNKYMDIKQESIIQWTQLLLFMFSLLGLIEMRHFVRAYTPDEIRAFLITLPKLTKLMLQNGADPHSNDEVFGITPLHVLMAAGPYFYFSTSVRFDQAFHRERYDCFIQIRNLFKDHKADFQRMDFAGRTPLNIETLSRKYRNGYALTGIKKVDTRQFMANLQKRYINLI